MLVTDFFYKSVIASRKRDDVAFMVIERTIYCRHINRNFAFFVINATRIPGKIKPIAFFIAVFIFRIIKVHPSITIAMLPQRKLRFGIKNSVHVFLARAVRIYQPHIVGVAAEFGIPIGFKTFAEKSVFNVPVLMRINQVYLERHKPYRLDKRKNDVHIRIVFVYVYASFGRAYFLRKLFCVAF